MPASPTDQNTLPAKMTAAAAAADPAGRDGAFKDLLPWVDPAPDLDQVLTGALLLLIDADLGEDTALVKAEEIGAALLVHFLSIANEGPRSVIYMER